MADYSILKALAVRRGETYSQAVPDAGASYDIALKRSAPELVTDALPGEVKQRRKRGATRGVERLATLPFSKIELMMIDARLDLDTLGLLLGGDVSRMTWYRWRADHSAVPKHVLSIIRMAAKIGPLGIGEVL